MADFVHVMKQWRRMCDKHTCSRNNHAYTGLPICPIAATHEGYPCDEDPIDWTEKATKQLEEIVMSWAAEHPEPVYPTWFEWLEQIEVAGRAYDLEPYFTGDKEVYLRTAAFTSKAFEPIPVDIAQKLGIGPKEG